MTIIQEMRKEINEATQRKEKTVHTAYLILINYESIKNFDLDDLAEALGHTPSYVTEIRKLFRLARKLKAEGVSLRKTK